jgi:hypothetical protein
MAGTKHPREGYGGTSESRQRGLSGDSFSERAPHTPQESDEARTTPDMQHQTVKVQVASEAEQEEPDGT